MIKHFTRDKALKCTVSHPYYRCCEFQTYSRFPSLWQLLNLFLQWCFWLHFQPLESIHFRTLLLSPFTHSFCRKTKEFAMKMSYTVKILKTPFLTLLETRTNWELLRESNYNVGIIYQLKTIVTKKKKISLKVQLQKLFLCKAEPGLVVFEALKY